MKRLRVRQRFGKYRIDGRLAEGGFAVVYKATDLIEGISVALKVPRLEAASSDEVKALEKEVRVTARLEHPGILPLKDASRIDGQWVLVSPLGKETMHERLRRRFAATTRLKLASQMVDAVAYAHTQRVLHLDIKPENFILFDDDRVRLGDFGIAKIANGTRALHGSGTGTVGYVAPEQALGRPSYRSDVFSLCLVLWRLYGGELPTWPFKWPLAGHERIEEAGGAEVLAILRRGLEVEERKRFKDAAALRGAFAEATRHHPPSEAPSPPKEKKRAAVLILEGQMQSCRVVDLGVGRAAIFATPRPSAVAHPNEDVVGAFPAGPRRCALAVADGCGGMPSGGLAAKLCVEHLQRAVLEPNNARRRLRDSLLDGVEQGNQSVLNLKKGAGTTLAVAFFEDGFLQTLHVGDAGVVVTGQRGRVRHVTLPHGPVGDAVRAGILHEEDAPFHEESHVVSNLVGSAEMFIELGPRLKLAKRDTVIVGSDGLFANFFPEELATLVRSGDLQVAGDEVARLCLDRMEHPGARPPAPDDLAFILFRLRSA